MPYTVDNPPSAVKGLPPHAIEIYVAAFNSALNQYNDEGKAAATAWAAVKTKYKKNDKGDWIAKESDVKESELSAEDKRNLLQSALEQKLPQPDVTSKEVPWVSDVYDTEVIYRVNGVDFKAPYTISEDSQVTIGEPVKVRRQTVYTPMESLRQRHSDIIQEIGRRNATADAGRIKKIMELCQELLSSEPTEESKVNEALKEADSVLAWLKEQASVKTEDGVQFPAAAFAYVPDSEKPSTWKLRIWEDLDKKVTRAQLGRAAAALSPGGFRGQKVSIPTEDLAAVKRKIRSAYRDLDVPDEEMPRWVKEVESRTLLTGFISLTEAKIDGRAIVTVIKPGFNSSKDRYYLPETLQRDFAVFEGVKMYADHPSEDEERNRPERSIKDWVATLKSVHIENGNVIGEAVIVEPWLREKLALLRDKKLLNEMGISINAVGTATQGEIEGIKTNVIERIVRARSVDFVTEAGAGGLVEMYEAEKDIDIDFIGLNTLKERRPDLVKEIESAIRAEIMREVKKQMDSEERIKQLETENATLIKERDDLRVEKETAEKASRIAATEAIIKEAVDKADLPDPAKTRILERFKNAEKTDGLAEAIDAESKYLLAINEAGKVKGLGGSNPDPESATKALRESFKKMHPEWTETQLDTAVRGR